MKGKIFALQRFSIHDGPGVRSTVFMQGCRLSCIWCHNPEGLSFDGCGDTIELEAKSVIDTVSKDKRYYDVSGGGMTLSGGEPLCQPEFCNELIELAKQSGIHTAIQTSSCEPLYGIRPDLILLDYKLTDVQTLFELTGAYYEDYIANLEYMNGLCIPIILRCPIIPGINDDDEHFAAIAKLTREYESIIGFELMPYHALGVNKYKNEKAAHTFPVPGKNAVESYRQAIISFGGICYE